MAKTIIKFILAFLPAVMLLIYLELLARTIPSSYSVKDKYLINKCENVNILVLGSSTANFGINPQYISDKMFNIANTSQDLYYDYKVLLKYLPKCINIKIVIIPIGYNTLLYNLTSGVEAWRANYYSLYLHIPKPENQIPELKQYSALALWDGPINVVKELRHGYKFNINEYGYQSLGPAKSSPQLNINDAKWSSSIIRHNKNMNTKFLDNNISIIDQIAKVCTEKNIKIIFITLPTFNTYSDHVNKFYYNIMTESLKNLSSKYSTDSYNYFYDNRFDVTDFTDGDHLNERGAKKFSLILKQEVIDRMLQ